MSQLEIRKGGAPDREWLFKLYARSLKKYIDQLWGWVEAYHRREFTASMRPELFDIVQVNGKDVGGYILVEKPNCYWLRMMLIEPGHRRRGLGSALLQRMQARAAAADKPLELSVFKNNPAQAFYARLGFTACREDEFMVFMRWRQNGPRSRGRTAVH